MGCGMIDASPPVPGGRIPFQVDLLSFPSGSASRAAIDRAMAQCDAGA